MKKAILLVLVLIMVLGCASLVACGGGGDGGGGGEGGETPPAVAGLTWDDIPIYAGAEQIQKGNWAMPPAQGDWSKVEWRYYRMNDEVNDVGMVTMFYKMEMPKNGWQEIGKTETPDMSWGYYSKNNEQDGAIVWVGSDERNTVFALMRAAR